MRSRFAFSTILACIATVSQADHGKDMNTWLRSIEGGFFHPDLEIRRHDPKDPTSPFAMFATADILAKEPLITVPRDALITAEGTVNACDTARNLVRELKLAEESKYGPYIMYLLDQSRGQLPSAWSNAGKKLLKNLLGSYLPPDKPTAASFADDCDEWGADEFTEHAYRMLLQRGWDDILVPVYDMLSHANGAALNTKSSTTHDVNQPVRVWASRTIKAGEEIYTTHNFCVDCDSRATSYGTPEILRDYGFIEQYPQRWIFPKFRNLAFELDKDADGQLVLSWLDDEPPTFEVFDFLERQVERLEIFANDHLEAYDTAVPKHEWDTIVGYQKALTNAMSVAVRTNEECLASESSDFCQGPRLLKAKKQRKKMPRYDALKEKPDALDYPAYTCEMGRTLAFPDHVSIDEIDSQYQKIEFYMNESNKDMCFGLDNVVQICGSYRPHYHEKVVHYTARYLDSVERVLWVGGGDSMLLHEIIKYPSLELVVGLEIDQQVTRMAFKYFGTQPHWENDKVQWWYGDAAKSLLMLPEDYFGSFDMVLVDLSETVMSMTVTEGLDIFGTLALLLKPDGIIVKNELYFKAFGGIFSYTTHIRVNDVPVLCSQSLVFGSYKNDMLTKTPIQHKTARNLYIKKESEVDDIYEGWHDYRRNSTGSQKHCREEGESDQIITKHDKSPGVVMILEAEDTTAMLQPSRQIKSLVENALEENGFKILCTIESASDDTGRTRLVTVFEAGYIVSRTWPQHNYCAFDIHLWSSLDKHDAIKQALVSAVGSPGGKSSSLYRIVAGGMFGTPSWEQEIASRGPRVRQICNKCDDTVRNVPPKQSDLDIILEQSLSIVQDDNMVVAVVCGRQNEACESLRVLSKLTNKKVKKIIPLYSCPGITHKASSLEEDILFACEKVVYNTLKDVLAVDGPIRMCVLDHNAPYGMVQIIHKILSHRPFLEFVMTDNVAFLALTVDKTEGWRRNFLERVRHDFVVYEPVFCAQVLLNSMDNSSTIEVGVTASGDTQFIQHLKEVTARMESMTGRVADIRNVQNGLFNFVEDFQLSQFFLPSDYDHTAPLEQYKSQTPLGFQTVFQLEVEWQEDRLVVGDRVSGNFEAEGEWFPGSITAVHDDNTYNIHYDDGDWEKNVNLKYIKKLHPSPVPSPTEMKLSAAQVKDALQHALSSINKKEFEDMRSATEIAECTSMGDGSVLMALWSGGTVVVLWDGRIHVDINLFTYRESIETADAFATAFRSRIPMLKIALRDQQPRGFGRVVNFLRDLLSPTTPRARPHWVPLDE